MKDAFIELKKRGSYIIEISNEEIKKMKQKIIIDTNIWYNISNEEIIKLKKDYVLVVPLIIMNEIYTSPNLFISRKTFESTKKAINAILSNIDNIKFVELNPFEFMLKEIYSDIRPHSNLDFYLKEFKAISDLDFKVINENYVKRFDIDGLTNFINVSSIDYKKIINLNCSSKEKFRESDTTNTFKSLIIKYANDNLQAINEFYPKITDLCSIKFELLINTFNSLLREVSKTGKKMENNDWVDIFLLAFVNENDLYWTREESKLKLIEDLKLEKYLFNEKLND